MIDLVLVGGFGRMGEAIRGVIQEYSHSVVLRAIVTDESSHNTCDTIRVTSSIQEAVNALDAPCVIDFSTPSATMQIASYICAHAIPWVIGTTGLNEEEMATLRSYATRSPILYSSNMSTGITAIRMLIPVLIEALGEGYDIEITDIHHNKKKDAPSGTALLLAHDLATAKGWDFQKVVRYARHGIDVLREKEEIGIQSIRGGGVFGVHTLSFFGEDEQIDITHHAYSRKAFARGALSAALWLIQQKPGALYSMIDMMKLRNDIME